MNFTGKKACNLKKQKNFPLLLGSLCSLVYFASYLTRGNMGAVISEICRARSFTAAQAAPIVTLGFWSYGIGQLLWGYLGRRLPSKGLMLTGLFLSGAVNLAVPFGRTVPVLAGLWFLNGLAQAAVWPPMSQLMAKGLPEKDIYSKVCTAVTMAGGLGTFALYLLSPWLIGRWNYGAVFFACGALALLAGLRGLLGHDLSVGGHDGGNPDASLAEFPKQNAGPRGNRRDVGFHNPISPCPGPG